MIDFYAAIISSSRAIVLAAMQGLVYKKMSQNTQDVCNNHHLAGGVLGQAAHHGVHLIKLLEGKLHL